MLLCEDTECNSGISLFAQKIGIVADHEQATVSKVMKDLAADIASCSVTFRRIWATQIELKRSEINL